MDALMTDRAIDPPLPTSDPMSPPDLEFLFEAHVKLHLPPLDVGLAPDGHRAVYIVKDGVFEGPRLSGCVIPNGGADWVRVRANGSSYLDVRSCLETHDGAMRYLHWHDRF